MAASTSEERFRPPFQLKIKTIQEKDSFFRSILLSFIKYVHPVESGLLDELYASSTLTDSDTESIIEDAPTRSDKVKEELTSAITLTKALAKKLHRCLKKLPLNVLLTKVGPLLCSNYPHLIPVEFQGNLEEDECDGLDQDCLRCGIQERIRPKTIADLLYAHHCLPDATYWEIQTGGCHHEGDWEKLFQAFRDVPDELNENLSNKMKSVLQRHHFRIPENLYQIMALNFPCQCAWANKSIQNLLAEQKSHNKFITNSSNGDGQEVEEVMAWQQAYENATSVSVTLGNMLSDQTPLELLSDGEEADDEDSSPHYPGSEEPFSFRNIKDFESESLPSSSDVLSPNYYWDRQRCLLEIHEEGDMFSNTFQRQIRELDRKQDAQTAARMWPETMFYSTPGGLLDVTIITNVHETFERFKRKVMTWKQADESATSVSVSHDNMLSDQTPLELLSDGEEAEDEDSSTHSSGSDGSEETFVTCDEDFENARKAWQQADESASNVSVAISIMLSDQTPLELLSDGEEADDEDSSTHYLGSEETFSSSNIKDFENEWLPSSSDALSGTTIFVDPQPYLPEVSDELTEEVYESFYHYTNYTGVLNIQTTGYIKDCHFSHYGSGVYLTTLTPSREKMAIARNYWRAGWHKRLLDGRAGYAICVRLPRNKVIQCAAGNGNIYKYTGLLRLSDYEWSVVKV